MVPDDDSAWKTEKTLVQEVTFRLLDFSKYILRSIKLYYEGHEKEIKAQAIEELEGD
jgi:hypothetical protein